MYGSGDSDSFSFDPNTQLPTGYKLNVGAKSQTATFTQNANHTMRQLSIADTIFGNENQTCVFTYDEFVRLTKDNCGSAWGAAYAYDLFGNMAKSTIAGSPGTSFQPTYSVSNRFATLPSGTPSYDPNGNLLNDSFHQYTWDNEGNPVTVSGNPITYDALNRRVEYYNSSVGYVQYLWAPYDATRNLIIVSLTGGQVQLPLPGGGQAMVGPSGVTEYRRANWQGSEPVDSSPSQTAIVDSAFTPYGEHYAENNYLGYFAGNLSMYPFFMDGYASTRRLYHYDQGRWISPDPAGLSAVDPSNPQTWNRYAYVAGNPLSNTDPSGLEQSNPQSGSGPNGSPQGTPSQIANCGGITRDDFDDAGIPQTVPCKPTASNGFANGSMFAGSLGPSSAVRSGVTNALGAFAGNGPKTIEYGPTDPFTVSFQSSAAMDAILAGVKCTASFGTVAVGTGEAFVNTVIDAVAGVQGFYTPEAQIGAFTSVYTRSNGTLVVLVTNYISLNSLLGHFFGNAVNKRTGHFGTVKQVLHINAADPCH